jgi:ATP-dependent RNA helicase DDX55/SPB4
MAPGKVVAKKDPRAWGGLTPPLAEWILDAVSSMGFKQMTPVQAATLPQFLGNKDVVVEVGLLTFPILIYKNVLY